MTDEAEAYGDPIHRTTDIPRIHEALRLARRDALRLHKRMGNPIAVWQDGQVVWIPPEEIDVDLDEEAE
jgi:hypothetical protein